MKCFLVEIWSMLFQVDLLSNLPLNSYLILPVDYRAGITKVGVADRTATYPIGAHFKILRGKFWFMANFIWRKRRWAGTFICLQNTASCVWYNQDRGIVRIHFINESICVFTRSLEVCI
jgi:hypothetical protein